MSLSKKLKELRNENGWTQQNLADLLKVDRSTVSKYETGKTIPTYQTVIQLADLYNVQKEYLVGELDGLSPKSELQGYYLKEAPGDKELQLMISLIQEEPSLKSLLLEIRVMAPKRRTYFVEKMLTEVKHMKKFKNL